MFQTHYGASKDEKRHIPVWITVFGLTHFDSLVKRDHGNFDFAKLTLSPFHYWKTIEGRNNDAVIVMLMLMTQKYDSLESKTLLGMTRAIFALVKWLSREYFIFSLWFMRWPKLIQTARKSYSEVHRSSYHTAWSMLVWIALVTASGNWWQSVSFPSPASSFTNMLYVTCKIHNSNFKRITF